MGTGPTACRHQDLLLSGDRVGHSAENALMTTVDLLERSTFVTRFGGTDVREPVLGRLHTLLSSQPSGDEEAVIEWLEDVVSWVFEGGRVPSRRAAESEPDARLRASCTLGSPTDSLNSSETRRTSPSAGLMKSFRTATPTTPAPKMGGNRNASSRSGLNEKRGSERAS